MTALNLYFTSIASTTLVNAGSLGIATGGTQGSGTWGTRPSAAVFVELRKAGGANLTASLPTTPSEYGQFLEPARLNLGGNTIPAGTFTCTMNLKYTTTVWTGRLAFQVWKRSSAGVYTKIGSGDEGADTALTTSYVARTASFTTVSPIAMAAGDQIYYEVYFDLSVRPGTSGSIQWYLATTTTGVATAQLVTPGYALSPVTYTLSSTGVSAALLRVPVTVYANPGDNLQTKAASLLPGDTLILNNGTYTASPGLYVSGVHGASANWITIKAANDGLAILDGGSTFTPLLTTDSSYISIEGLHAQNSNENVVYIYAGSGGGPVDHVTLKRVTAHDAGPGNFHVFSTAWGATNCLLEDCAGWGHGRYIFDTYQTHYTTLRRCFAYWQTVSDVVTEPRASFNLYASDHAIFENCIGLGAEPFSSDSADNWYTALWQTTDDQVLWPTDNCQILGCVFYGSYDGYFLNNYSGSNNLYKDCYFESLPVATSPYTTQDHSNAFTFNGCAYPQTLQNCTFRNSTTGLLRRGTLGTVTFQSNAVVGNTTGIVGTDPGHTYCGFYGNTANGVSTVGTDKTSDPGYDTTTYGRGGALYVKSGSAWKGQGASGSDIGANILYQYIDGALTSTQLWPWPMESRVVAELGVSPTYEATGGLWKTLSGLYGGVKAITGVSAALKAVGVTCTATGIAASIGISATLLSITGVSAAVKQVGVSKSLVGVSATLSVPSSGAAYATDTFTRADQSGFGTASDTVTTYNAYVNTPPTLAIASNEGQITLTALGQYGFILAGSQTPGDTDITFRVSVNNTTANFGATLRSDATATAAYRVRVNGTNIVAYKGASTSSGGTAVGTGATITAPLANTFYWFRAQMLAGVIKAKVWKDGDIEPAWQYTATDASPVATGRFGFYIYDATNLSVYKVDHLTVTNGSSVVTGSEAITGVSASFLQTNIKTVTGVSLASKQIEISKSLTGVSAALGVSVTTSSKAITGVSSAFIQINIAKNLTPVSSAFIQTNTKNISGVSSSFKATVNCNITSLSSALKSLNNVKNISGVSGAVLATLAKTSSPVSAAFKASGVSLNLTGVTVVVGQGAIPKTITGVAVAIKAVNIPKTITSVSSAVLQPNIAKTVSGVSTVLSLLYARNLTGVSAAFIQTTIKTSVSISAVIAVTATKNISTVSVAVLATVAKNSVSISSALKALGVSLNLLSVSAAIGQAAIPRNITGVSVSVKSLNNTKTLTPVSVALLQSNITKNISGVSSSLVFTGTKSVSSVSGSFLSLSNPKALTSISGAFVQTGIQKTISSVSASLQASANAKTISGISAVVSITNTKTLINTSAAFKAVGLSKSLVGVSVSLVREKSIVGVSSAFKATNTLTLTSVKSAIGQSGIESQITSVSAAFIQTNTKTLTPVSLAVQQVGIVRNVTGVKVTLVQTYLKTITNSSAAFKALGVAKPISLVSVVVQKRNIARQIGNVSANFTYSGEYLYVIVKASRDEITVSGLTDKVVAQATRGELAVKRATIKI